MSDSEARAEKARDDATPLHNDGRPVPGDVLHAPEDGTLYRSNF